MSPEGKALQPEREQTDAGLRTERARTDVELVTQLRAAEQAAVSTVESAREEADEMLNAARREADIAPGVTLPAAPKPLVAQARAIEDATRERERAVADDRLHQDREDSLHALLRLLPLEREKTDLYLLTERARSDAAISHRDDFLSIVSHDLRNLLSTVALGARFIEETEGQGPDSATLRTARSIRRVSARMNRLIGDLLDVSSIESGKLGITRARGDATALVAEAVEMFRPTASAKGISLDSDPIEPALSASFDHDRVLQVLANLIGNAIKFTPSGGGIRVGGTLAANDLRFSVRDTGPGIPEAQLEAVFERFWQVGAGDRRGLGLGLYIAKGIVEAHGGRIWVESNAGQGSAFHVSFAQHQADQPG